MCDELSVALECRNNMQLFSVKVSCPDCAPINHQTRAIEPTHGHDTARHILIATGDRDVRVILLRGDYRLDRIGNEIARLQREAHAIRSH